MRQDRGVVPIAMRTYTKAQRVQAHNPLRFPKGSSDVLYENAAGETAAATSNNGLACGAFVHQTN
jgi:hypothetical protein